MRPAGCSPRGCDDVASAARFSGRFIEEFARWENGSARANTSIARIGIVPSRASTLLGGEFKRSPDIEMEYEDVED
jgi:hypothetical protein